jgi:hypothetical protein
MEAKNRIESGVGATGRLPESARNFYIFDGGNFSGSIIYVSFDCGGREDCWEAITRLGGPDRSKFRPWAESRYAVVMEGPGFYHDPLKKDPSDVRRIKSGTVYERVDGDHANMYYCAIDFDLNRVYYHRESGGFRPDAYQPPTVMR